MEVRFCSECSHVVPPHYFYCPQCGARLTFAPDLDALLDRCLKPLEEMEHRNRQHRLTLLLSRLELLDEGLALLLEEGRKEREIPCR